MGLLPKILSYGLWLWVLPFLWLHPKMRGHMGQRLGRYPDLEPAPADQPRFWLHGASAGDVLALAPTAHALRRLNDRCQIIVTTLTASGVAMGHRQGRTFDHVFVSPLDVPWAVRRAMGRLKPSVLVLEYTELWPQLIDGAKRAGVALALHNGRFGLGRLWRYRLLFALTGNLLRLLDLLLMRDEAQGARAIKLGARPSAVLVTGNTKFDNLHRDPDVGLVKEILEQTGWPASGGPILVYGSTHEGEEQLLLQTFAALQKDMPSLKLIIAPRYPERAERIEGLCSRLGLVALLRCGGTPVIQGRADVLVLNTVGELAACYALGTAIFVGGSFVPRGGQNILEPAALAKPVVFGPHMHNFADAVAVLAGRGGIQVRTPQGLYRVLLDLLSHPKICADLGAIAQAQVKAVRGAAERNARHLMQLVHAQTPPRGAADP